MGTDEGQVAMTGKALASQLKACYLGSPLLNFVEQIETQGYGAEDLLVCRKADQHQTVLFWEGVSFVWFLVTENT